MDAGKGATDVGGEPSGLALAVDIAAKKVSAASGGGAKKAQHERGKEGVDGGDE